MSLPPKGRDENRRFADGESIVMSLNRADTEFYAPLRERMTAAEITSQALEVGEDVPDFFLPDERGRLYSLRTLLQDGPIVLMFMGGSWCPFCISRLKAVIYATGQLGRVVAITPETGPFPRAMKAANALDCLILSDVDYGVGLLFGLIYLVPNPIITLMEVKGIKLGAMHGSSKPMLSAPATYVVAPSGKVLMRAVDSDYTRGADTQMVVQALSGAG